MSKIDRILDEEKLHLFEGESGVRNLARLCRLIGYKDEMYFGQFQDGAYGDLILFLEDNSGAVEAIIDFMRENEELYLPEEEEEEE